MIRRIQALNYRCLRYVDLSLDRFHVLIGSQWTLLIHQLAAPSEPVLRWCYSCAYPGLPPSSHAPVPHRTNTGTYDAKGCGFRVPPGVPDTQNRCSRR